MPVYFYAAYILKYNAFMDKKNVIIIGAGPAGLSCAYSLIGTDYTPIIIEADSSVGGLAKTIYENGNGTDIGPHRFYTKNDKIMNLWDKILPIQGALSCDDILTNRNIILNKNGPDPEKENNVFLRRKRFSRIYYSNHFLDYPLKLNFQNLFALGISKTFIAGLSYLKSCFYKIPETNLESYMINHFGKVLYELFFKDYTQKVWGVHPAEISKEWGVQRIKGISLSKILLNAFCLIFAIKQKKEISLTEEYFYPKLGSSQLWDAMAEKIKQSGGKIILNSEVIYVNKKGNKIVSVKVRNKNGSIMELFGDIFVSSMPIKTLFTNMNDVPQKIYNSAANLSYRDFILVNFVTKKINLKNNTKFPTINNIAPDSWIYLQDKGIKAGRLDIINNFSPYIVKNYKENVVINLEYFCNENDEFWNESDENIINFAVSELKKLSVIDDGDIKTSKVIRIKKAYPSYFGSGYDKFEQIKDYINTFDNLYCIGRNGQHKYNNMDHSVLSGLTASRVIMKDFDKNILWGINTDSEYQEFKNLK